MQQQFAQYATPLNDKIQTLVRMFQKCGGKSAEYKLAIKDLPIEEKLDLDRAVNSFVAMVQQQEQQYQM